MPCNYFYVEGDYIQKKKKALRNRPKLLVRSDPCHLDEIDLIITGQFQL